MVRNMGYISIKPLRYVIQHESKPLVVYRCSSRQFRHNLLGRGHGVWLYDSSSLHFFSISASLE